MALQLPDGVITKNGIASTAPSGADANAIDLTVALPQYNMRPERWILTAVVTVAPSDLTIWGLLAAGNQDDATDDLWGLHNDKFLAIKDGKIGTALAVGIHHFIVMDLGVYARLYFQKSAGTVDIRLTPVIKTGRSS